MDIKDGDKMLKFDYSKLKGKIKEIYDTQINFAKAMNLSEKTISDKLNNKIFFGQDEIIKACELLQIPFEEISLYFFCNISSIR
jgi:transcriptional regulator with XRE-family HTH domain